MLRYFASTRIELLVVVLMFGSVCRSHAQQSIYDPAWNGGNGPDGRVYATMVQSSGKILIGGSFTNVSGHYSPFLARLNPDGSFDDSFAAGTDGTVNRLLQLANGDVLVAGEFTQLQGYTRRCLGMLRNDGMINAEFDASEAYLPGEAIYSVAVQEDGKIVTGSMLLPESGREASRLTRLESSGSLDTAFTRTDFSARIFAILPLQQGKLLVGGTFQAPGHGLVLVDSAGLIENTFSDLLATNSSVFVLQRLTNGNILIGGALVEQEKPLYFMLHQLTPDWKWSSEFAPVQGEMVPGQRVRAALVQPDGKIVIGGDFYSIQGHWRRHIARVNASGVVDPCFNPTMGLGGSDAAYALAFQADNRIIVGGRFSCFQVYGATKNLARLLPQTDCAITRLDFFRREGGFTLFANTPPGGTNYLQSSTNGVDWKNVSTNTEPYFDMAVDTEEPASFFRIKRTPQ